MNTLLLIARLALAGVFALAAVTKLADRAGTRRAASEFGAPNSFAALIAWLLPLAEFAVAGALLMSPSARYGAIGAMVLLALFAGAIGRSMIRGEAPDCHCFGQLHSAPAGWRTLARNAALGALGAFVILGGAGVSAVAWIGSLDGAGIVALAGGCALVVAGAAAASFMLALLKQNGRLLLRVDELARRLDHAGVAPLPAPSIDPAHGLPVGEPAPAFTLAGLYGDTVTLAALTSADLPLMLLFTDPNCGPCNALMPQIARWQREHMSTLSIALLTRGAADDNRAKVREHGVSSVWIDADLAVYNAYRVPGTPAAVLIDTQARIGSPLGAGVDAIAALIAQVTGAPVEVLASGLPQVPPAHSAAAPPGLPVGADAPAVDLTDLAGKRVALAHERGDTLVLFWNCACGFCRQMLDELRAFEAQPRNGAPRLLLISTGSVEENRAIGLRAPILLDQRFATGTAFGTTGTPSAVLVDRHGKIASALGIGAPAVMALARRSPRESPPATAPAHPSAIVPTDGAS